MGILVFEIGRRGSAGSGVTGSKDPAAHNSQAAPNKPRRRSAGAKSHAPRLDGLIVRKHFKILDYQLDRSNRSPL
jgi:hypothetical protein